jgi:drug/metabolite transporter (DMT)-like permease
MNLSAHNKQTISPAAIWSALVAVYIVWGSTYLAIRFAVETMPPFLMASFRFLVAGVLLYAFRRARGDAAPTKREWRSAAIVGLFLLLGGNGSVVWAEQRVASGIAALLVGTVPLWMVLIDALRPSGHRPTGREAFGVLVGFAGIALLIGPGQLANSPERIDPAGVVALMLCALSWSIGSLYSRNAALPSSPLLGTGMEMLAGGAGLFLLGTLAGEWGRLNLAGISTQSLLGVAFLIVFGSWVGFTAYTWLLRAAPTPLVSTYAYVNPLVALLLGYMLAEELLTPRDLIAAATILGSVVLIKAVQPLSTTKVTRPELVTIEDR